MKGDDYSLMISLHLTQKKPERVMGDLKEKNVLMESLQEACKAKRRAERTQRKRSGETTRLWRCGACVQECFYGFAWAVYN